MTRSEWIYLSQLTRALRLERVDGRAAGDLVAEIDAQLAASGVDPVEEFGRPVDVARELAERPGSRRPSWVPPGWALYLLGLVVTILAVTLVDVLVQGSGDEVPIRLRAVVYGGLFHGLSVWLAQRAADRLDGRSWTSPLGGRGLLAVIAVAVVVTTATQLAGDRVVVTVDPAAYLAVAGTLGLALLAVLIARDNPPRFPAHARHLRRLRWGPLALRPSRRSGGSTSGDVVA